MASTMIPKGLLLPTQGISLRIGPESRQTGLKSRRNWPRSHHRSIELDVSWFG